jgi:hypothetical protein
MHNRSYALPGAEAVCKAAGCREINQSLKTSE